MKHLISIFTTLILIFMASGCNMKKGEPAIEEQKDSTIVNIPDTALYGIVGENTTMHILELQTEDGTTMSFAMNLDTLSDIQGGVFTGDKVTLTIAKNNDEDEPTIIKLVNLTSLLGKWTSLDRNFEIQEDGIIASTMKAESNPYTQWSMANGSLILNADTFSILSLGSDSLAIENKKGIFVYKRQK